MDNEFVGNIERPSVSELRKQAGLQVVAFGLWLRLSIIGAGMVVAGLLLAFDDPSRPLSTLALALGGGVLAATAWRRAARILGAGDDVTRVEASLRSRARAASAVRSVETTAT
jgi:hypothetical protein